jgi:uroporphyrinogen-III synthase
MEALGVPLSASPRLASVGPATTAAIQAAWPGAHVEVQPESEFRAASLVTAFAGVELRHRRVLLPVSDRAGDTVARGLESSGARVDTVVAYSTVLTTRSDALERELAQGVAAVALASPSAVTAFCAAAGRSGQAVPVAVMGPTTAEAARGAGLMVRGTADPATVEGMVQALARLVAAASGGAPTAD